MIHLFALRGHYLVLDVYSGAVHLVDEPTYRMLELLEPPLTESYPSEILSALEGEYPQSELKETYAELFSLYRAEQLFASDDYGRFAENMVRSPVKAMCLNVSHDCNLRCSYCFAGKGDYNSGRMVMTPETGRLAIDYLIAHSEDRRFLEVDFFGGEPLMNFDMVKDTVAYARSLEESKNKKFRFTITTNGLLLDDDKIAFINREMDNVVLSLDGRREVNDRVRRRVDGSGCYDAVAQRFQKLVQARGDKEYYVRGTYTAYNKDFSKDVLALRELGFDQISVEPVVANPNEDYALTEADLPDLFAEYDRLAELQQQARQEGRVFNFFHFMVDLDQGPCAIKRLRGCGCGNEYVAVTPDGDVYPCHQFIGQDGWKMGSVHDGSLDAEKKDLFSNASVYSKPDCSACWAKFYCSGGCNANNAQYRGDIRKPHTITCELEKKRLECAIALQVERRLAAMA